MPSPSFILISPRVNSYYFSDAINNGLDVLDQADFQNQILPWQWLSFYTQKAQMSDPVTLQFHTYDDAPPELTICDINLNPVSSAITTALNAAPYFKGAQVFPGNVWTDPFTNIEYGLKTWQYNFLWSNFSAYVTPDTPLSFYYIRFTVPGSPARVYYSEPIFLKTLWPNTALFTCQYKANRAANTNVITSGWFNDYPANLDPYYPLFAIRGEAYVLPLDPKAVNIGYLIHNYQQNFIYGQQLPVRTLKLGELCTGIPDYLLQMVTEVLLSDQFFINGYWYKVYNPSTQTAPAEIWKSKRNENVPLLRANTVLTLGSFAQQAMVTPTPTTPSGYYSSDYYEPTNFQT